MKRGIISIMLVVSLATATYYAGRQHDLRLSKAFERVRPGMSVVQAEAILGAPSWHGRCGAKFPYGWKQGCIAELGYRSAFAPLLPAYIVIQFDGQSRVISVDMITSP